VQEPTALAVVMEALRQPEGGGGGGEHLDCALRILKRVVHTPQV
jgi:hypothetical protein